MVTKVVWDCVPSVRRRLLTMVRATEPVLKARLVAASELPQTTVTYAMEGLEMLGLVSHTGGQTGQGKEPVWYSLTDQARAIWPSRYRPGILVAARSHEKSVGPISPIFPTPSDFS